MQNFPQRLESAIQRSGKQKGELAEHCGVALSTVSRWLGGSVPKAETLDRISGFLGVDAKWLIFGGDNLADEAKLRDVEAPYRLVPYHGRRQPLRDRSILERLKNLEDEHAAMKAKIDKLTELIQGKDT